MYVYHMTSIISKQIKLFPGPAVVAWFIKASVFHSVNSAPSVNGGSNPARECCINRLNSKEFDAIKLQDPVSSLEGL